MITLQMTRWPRSDPSVTTVFQSASATSDRDRHWRGFASTRHLLPPALRTVGGWWTTEHRVGRSRSVRCPLGQRPRDQRVRPGSSPTRFCVLESSLQDESVQRSWRGRSRDQCMWDCTSPASSRRPVYERRKQRITTWRSALQGCALSAPRRAATRSVSPAVRRPRRQLHWRGRRALRCRLGRRSGPSRYAPPPRQRARRQRNRLGPVAAARLLAEQSTR
jgi:hypothetical protein